MSRTRRLTAAWIPLAFFVLSGGLPADAVAEVGVCEERPADCVTCRTLDDDIEALFVQPDPGAVPQGGFHPEPGVPQQGLFLSGGGSHGAWGAGVLYGAWLKRREAGETAPQFDLVTGVSTGALMSTLVFLGSETDYEDLRCIYTTSQEREIQRCSAFHALFGSAYCSRAPLRRLVTTAMEQERRFERLLEIQSEEDHRHLKVGTVDLECGDFCTWDMGCIAAKGEDAREEFLDVVMASANAPGVGPPVELSTGHHHVDGGTREQIFIDQVRELHAFGLESGDIPEITSRRAYFLVNQSLDGDIRYASQFPHTITNALRGTEILTNSALIGNLHMAVDAVRKNGGIQVHRSSIPAEFRPDFARREFDTEKMKRLFEEGCAWGHEHHPDWPPPGQKSRTLPEACKVTEEVEALCDDKAWKPGLF